MFEVTKRVKLVKIKPMVSHPADSGRINEFVFVYAMVTTSYLITSLKTVVGCYRV
jgi:hypothetical protein